jgi:hypothetical protein
VVRCQSPPFVYTKRFKKHTLVATPARQSCCGWVSYERRAWAGAPQPTRMSFLPQVRSSSSVFGREPMQMTREPWRASAVREGLRASMSGPQRRVQQQLLTQQRKGSNARLQTRSAGALLEPISSFDGVPNLELAALNAIKKREDSLSRLHTLLLRGCGPLPQDAAQLPTYAALLSSTRTQVVDALCALRLAGTEVVEAIVRWRRRRRRQLEPFVWNSHNYLLKMLVDVFFLGLSETVTAASADPFLLMIRTEPPASSEPPSVLAAAAQTSGPPKQGERRAARHRRLAQIFSPDRSHTKHELVRMWAAQRILEAERSQVPLPSADVPTAPDALHGVVACHVGSPRAV